MEQGYSQREAAKISGVAQAKLSRLKKSGAIVPDLPDGKYSAALIDKIRAEYGKPVTADNAPVDAQEAAQATEMPADEQTHDDSENVVTDAVSKDTESVDDNHVAEQIENHEDDAASIVSEDDAKEISTAQAETDTITIEVPFELVTLDERAARIRKLSADVQRGIIEIGNELIAAKRDIGHGNWTAWLKNEFDWSVRTAQNFMAVAERFGKNENVFVFKSATLQAMLALPFGTEQEFIYQQAENGTPVEEMSARQVQSAVKEFNRQREEELNTLANGDDSIAEYGDAQNLDDATGQFTHDETANTGVCRKFGSENPADESPTSDGQSETKAPPPPISFNHDGSVEYYTPAEYIEAARRVLGTIDLDPASCEKANETVKATKIYTKENSGLDKFWEGTVWMNPPYSKGLIDKFVDKLTSSGGVTAWIVLVPARTDRAWFEMLAAFSDAIVFSNHRVKCLRNGVDDTSGPTAGSVFFYRGDAPENFYSEFQQFGWAAKFVAPSR